VLAKMPHQSAPAMAVSLSLSLPPLSDSFTRLSQRRQQHLHAPTTTTLAAKTPTTATTTLPINQEILK